MPDPSLKVTSAELTTATGDPATSTAVMYATLCVASCVISDPEDEAGAASGAPANSEETPILLTTLSEGPVSAFLTVGPTAVGVRVVDATAPASSPTSHGPAVFSIIEHPSGRMVASINTRLDADTERVATDLPERVGAVLIGGHNPALAYATLTLGVPEVDGEDLFAPLEACPLHPRILDGGSQKEWLTPLLGFADIAIVSEDFAPPLMARLDGAQIAEFLQGFGTTRTTCMRGDRTMQYWWDDTSGEIPVKAVPDASTLGAGDAFHGVLVWAIERGGDAGPKRLVRFASSATAVSVSSFGTRQWLTSRAPVELARGQQIAAGGARVARWDPAAAGPRQDSPSATSTTMFSQKTHPARHKP